MTAYHGHGDPVQRRTVCRTKRKGRPTPKVPSDPEMEVAAETLCSLREEVLRNLFNAQRSALRNKRRSDTGRKVIVLWVPSGFPEDQEPVLENLVPFSGLVVKHHRSRKGGTHLVRYVDGQCGWLKLNKLVKFLT